MAKRKSTLPPYRDADKSAGRCAVCCNPRLAEFETEHESQGPRGYYPPSYEKRMARQSEEDARVVQRFWQGLVVR